MADEGVRDFHAAKRRACERLGLAHDHRHLPANHEIEAALQDHLQLFHGQALPARRRRLRTLALEAMGFLDRFEPRLVGPVLSGTVTEHTAIELLLTADNEETSDTFSTNTAYRTTCTNAACVTAAIVKPSSRLPLRGRRRHGGDWRCFDRVAAREPPLSPVDGKPMHRASRREVEEPAQARRLTVLRSRVDADPARRTSSPGGISHARNGRTRLPPDTLQPGMPSPRATRLLTHSARAVGLFLTVLVATAFYFGVPLMDQLEPGNL